MAARTIYKLLTRAEWEAALQEGFYRGSAHDRRDGFIHFSTAAQLGETARKYFSGAADLVLLSVETGALNERFTHDQRFTPYPNPLPAGEGAETASLLPEGEGQDEGSVTLRWEPSRGGGLFPHLYANLPLSAVKDVTALALGDDGVPVLPVGFLP